MTPRNPEATMTGTKTRFAIEPQPGRWDPGLGRIVTELEDAAYKRGWNSAVDEISTVLGMVQAGLAARIPLEAVLAQLEAFVSKRQAPR